MQLSVEPHESLKVGEQCEGTSSLTGDDSLHNSKNSAGVQQAVN
jgi:hypothetical protein